MKVNEQELQDQAREAFAHMDGKMIIPWDCHPGNLMVTREGHLKLMDLGLYTGSQDAKRRALDSKHYKKRTGQLIASLARKARGSIQTKQKGGGSESHRRSGLPKERLG